MHRTGHWLGLDVHDAGEYKENGAWRPLQPGMMLTVEPGCYVRPAEGVPEQYWNIGIRIEDDYVVTEQGVEWVSRAPREIAEVEAMMRETIAGVAKRDSTKVEWYRRTGGPRAP
jgi:Xaa-Pro aminopeptidase